MQPLLLTNFIKKNYTFFKLFCYVLLIKFISMPFWAIYKTFYILFNYELVTQKMPIGAYFTMLLFRLIFEFFPCMPLGIYIARVLDLSNENKSDR